MADAEADKKTDAETGEGAAGGKLKRILRHKLTLPLGGALLSAGLAVALSGIVFPVTDPNAEVEEEVPEPEPVFDLESLGPPVRVKLPVVQVSLADKERDAFARMELFVEFRSPNASAVQAQIEGDLAIVVQDALITFLSNKQYVDFKVAQAKELMKIELIDILDTILFPDKNQGRVTDVLYQQLLVQ